MTKRVSRRVLALAAAGLLVSPVIAQSVSAQTNVQVPINVRTVISGTVPSGVTGYKVDVTCNKVITDSNVSPRTFGTVTNNITFGTAAASSTLYYGITGAVSDNPTGSSCIAVVTQQGTANTTVGGVRISIGGVNRTVSTAPIVVNGVNQSVTTVLAFVPVFSTTDIVVTIVYPSITVRKAVVGDEVTAGADYVLNLTCADYLPGTADVTNGVRIGNGALGNTAVVGPPVVAANFGSGISYLPLNLSIGARAVYDAQTAPLSAVSVTLPVTTGTLFTGVVGDAAFFASLSAADQAIVVASAGSVAVRSSSFFSPVGASAANPAGFTGSFTLKSGVSRVFNNADIPLLTGNSRCVSQETDAKGMTGVTITSTSTLSSGLPGALVNGSFIASGTSVLPTSAITPMGETITFTNAQYGDLWVSKVVTGDPKTNIATYLMEVSCDKGGPKDTFLLKDRQTKVYSNITVGTNCLITEKLSDGAVASYNDNSGENVTDGRVTVKRTCNSITSVSGSPTSAIPGGPSPTSTFDSCTASVIITNSYVPVTTTAAPTTVAPAAPTVAPTTVAPTTAAPAVTPAPATPIEATPTFTG